MEDKLYDEWVPLSKREKLSYGRIFAIACCNLIQGLSYNIINITVKPFLSELGFKGIAENMMLLIGSVVGFFMVPLLGVFSDGLMLKFGRRRIFVIIGTFLIVISFSLLAFYKEIGIFLSKDNPLIAQKVIYVISVILSFVSVNIVQQPARVLCSDVTPPSQQNFMAGICQLYNGFAPLASNILTVYLPEIKGLSFIKLNLILTFGISFIAMIISCIAAPEEPLRVKPPKVNPFSQIFEAFKKIPRPFARIILPFFFANGAIFPFYMQFTDFMGRLFEKEYMIYDDGIKHAMLCLSVNNAIQLVYSFLNNRVCDLIGMKWTMIIGNAILGVCLLLFEFIRERYAYFAIIGILGFSQVIFQTVPFAIVSLVIPTEELGSNFGILNCFCVIGQQLTNWGFGLLVDHVYPNDPFAVRKKISYSSSFGFLATIASFWIIQPTLAETGQYQQIPDESGAAVEYAE